MLSSDSRRTPACSPDTTDIVANPVTTAMIATWAPREISRPKTWSSPALTCMAPSPSDVATPNRVLTTASTSMASPNGPWIRSPKSGWNALRIDSGSPFRKPKYASARPTTQ